ncbi:MAG: HAMP domain-containing histidine kinase [Eubacterium sp.]|nr:HAMP domain-containing histidine kinase [Eubacterium sp.]
MALSGLKSKPKGRGNIFLTYFLMFASIFLVTFVVLGTSLIILVNKYAIDEKTNLLRENTQSIAKNVSQTLIVNNMNSDYSYEKEVICESLLVVSNCIDSDVFVCDNEGKIILCREQVGISPYYDASMVCDKHKKFKVKDNLIQRVFEDGNAFASITIDNKEYYIVGTAIIAPTYSHGENDIIGSVFAIVESGTTELVSSVLKIFIIVAVICLLAGCIMIWLLTKRMVTPLRQMSAAAKSFALGDFSYRVKISSNDELADLEYAFNEMADALDKLENSRRSFVANVSHELKTPMTSIAGFIDGILDGTIPKDKQEYYLKIVSDEVRRLSRLVVAMLNMSKMESGDFEMKRKNYNITDQIIHILLTFEQKIEKKNIEIRGLEDAKPYRVNADADMIYQVIYNLFDNAVKFTNENGYINISLSEKGNFIEVSIANSGEGINKAELSRIFERFYKVDKSRSLDAKGAGHGLYIVKMVVEMHGGRIWAESNSENEACFIFLLPKAK